MTNFEFFTFCIITAFLAGMIVAIPLAYQYGKAQGKNEYIDRVSEIFGGE